MDQLSDSEPPIATPKQHKKAWGIFAGAVALVVVVAFVAVALVRPDATQGEQVSLSNYYEQSISWSKCKYNSKLDCGSVDVPLDYSNPQGAELSIAMERERADQSGGSSSDKLGTIFFNPGGPGAPGLGYLSGVSDVLGSKVTKAYDMVTFDPRGVGASGGFTCLDTQQMDSFMSTLGPPNDVVDQDQVAQSAASMGLGCVDNAGDVAPHVGTINVARDLDIMRAAVGDQRLNFFGASYGSYIGQGYATLFPENVGRNLWDGVLPMTLDNVEIAHGQADGFEDSLRRFIVDCPKTDDCPLPSSPKAAESKIAGLLDQLGKRSMPALPDRPLTQALAYNGMLSSLYDSGTGWSELSTALGEAFDNDGTALLELSDAYTDRENGEYSDAMDAFYAVSCVDSTYDIDPSATVGLAKEWSSSAPIFGSYLAWSGLPCYQWPVPASSLPKNPDWSTLPAILLVNYERDPATPLAWAQLVDEQLPNSSLIKVAADGHVASFDSSQCVSSKITDYFLTGQLPASRATCTLD